MAMNLAIENHTMMIDDEDLKAVLKNIEKIDAMILAQNLLMTSTEPKNQYEPFRTAGALPMTMILLEIFSKAYQRPPFRLNFPRSRVALGVVQF